MNDINLYIKGALSPSTVRVKGWAAVCFAQPSFLDHLSPHDTSMQDHSNNDKHAGPHVRIRTGVRAPGFQRPTSKDFGHRFPWLQRSACLHCGKSNDGSMFHSVRLQSSNSKRISSSFFPCSDNIT